MVRAIRKGLTFDDVLLVPKYSEILPSKVNTKTRLADNILLNIPIISAAMDTVTTATLAIAIARLGGLGIIHKNMTITQQAAEVLKVKKAEDGLILDPITLKKNATVKEALEIMEQNKIGGIPIIDSNNIPIGIVTKGKLKFKDPSLELKMVMVPKEDLVTATKGISIKSAEKILREKEVERLIVVDEDGKLYGLITYHDSSKVKEYPLASKDKNGQLLAGAAVGATDDLMQRVRALVEAGVDIVCLDSAHGHSKNVIDAVKKIKTEFSNLPVIAGNVATKKGALALAAAGADVVKVGIGPGSICTTRVVAGCGVPQFTAISDVADALKNKNVAVIGDGGIRYSGDMVKALAVGATCIMAGSLFAGTEEAPGETIFFENRKYKSYRGMGSLGAMQEGSGERYGQNHVEAKKLVPEGIEGRVPYKGTVAEVVYQFIGGLKSGMGYCGAENISMLQDDPEFIQITPSGIAESHPHDVAITKQAPNYN